MYTRTFHLSLSPIPPVEVGVENADRPVEKYVQRLSPWARQPSKAAG
jgi:hypothetical protein